MSDEKFPHLQKPVEKPAEKPNAIEAVLALMELQSRLHSENEDLKAAYQRLQKDHNDLAISLREADDNRRQVDVVKAENGRLKATRSDLIAQLEKGRVELESVKESQQAAREEQEAFKVRKAGKADKQVEKAVEVSQQKLAGKTKKLEEAKKRLEELKAANAAQKARLVVLQERTASAAVDEEKFVALPVNNNLPVLNGNNHPAENGVVVHAEGTSTPVQASQMQTASPSPLANLSVVASVTATLGASAAGVVASASDAAPAPQAKTWG